MAHSKVGIDTGCTFQDGRMVRSTPHPRKDDWGALGINLQQIMGYPLLSI